MAGESSQSGSEGKLLWPVCRLYRFLAPRAHSIIIAGALFCTLAVKLFHAWRIGLLHEYFGWILTDVSVLLTIEVILALLCFRWPRRWILRTAYVFAAVVCTWSVMNAGWLIRTGTQILPTVLLPLLRDPLNALGIIGVNLAKMPAAAVILLAPSAVALAFFFSVLAKPKPPDNNPKFFAKRIIIFFVIIVLAILARPAFAHRRAPQIVSQGLRYNSQLKALVSLFFSNSGRLARSDLATAVRTIPTFDQLQLPISKNPKPILHNVVVVVLEGIQYRHTSLADKTGNLTPYLAGLAEHGAEFTNARSSLTHTTKVLFGLLTGRFPSVSQDLAEAVPASKPYASIATILKEQFGFRTVFFQSAKGNFEARPGLIHNLGFDKFWARDDLNDPNSFLGYLACDEFAMIKPVTEWIKADTKPFFLMILCSVTHDPYEVPQWFATPAKAPLERYRQAILYTDKFLAALDAALAKLNLTDKTIFCVIGDHGEAFGEHGLLGHERIAFDEVLRVPFCLRAPSLVEPTKVTLPVSSVDLTPTLLALFGFQTHAAGFDGINVLAPIPDDRKVYFSGWLRQSPAGFVKANRKFIYNPADGVVSVYDLTTDPLELIRMELPQQIAQRTANEIIAWRKDSIFRIDQKHLGRRVLFGSWLCRWNNRVALAKYHPKTTD
ncbi:MAG: sulfatase-like hydrolase/transferase [Planctomycetota bacterium]|nr:MAG: sulfatase-like hydrolase/transferase [Planctomycetota bacterium]